MRYYDVIICGGGPGGSTAATFLARAGRKVLVLDKAKFPRVKICAGWITPAVLRELELQPEDYPHTLQPFNGGTVYAKGDFHDTWYEQTMSYGIIRREFDNFLLERARDSGAEVRDGTKVKSFERVDGGVAVRDEDGNQLGASLLIGAGGNGCPVSKHWGERSGKESIILATESETNFGACTLRELTPYYGAMELFSQDDGYGYAWYVTKGDFLNIGIGRFSDVTDRLPPYLDAFMQKLSDLGRLRGIEDKLDKFGRHAYKLYDDIPRRKSGDRFLIVGDAGGFATRWAGEGIKPAVQTGKLAAGVAHEALAICDTGADFLQSYSDECDQLYGEQRVTWLSKVVNHLPARLRIAAMNRICTNPHLRRKLIFEHAFGFEPVEEAKQGKLEVRLV